MRSTEPLLSTHPLTEPRKGDRFCVVLQWKEMPTSNHFLHSNQSMNTRPCCGGLKDQQPNSPRQRLGYCMPCGDSAPEGQKHSPNDNAFALSGRRLFCCLCSPECCPGLMAQCPFSGAHSAIRFVDCDISEGMP